MSTPAAFNPEVPGTGRSHGMLAVWAAFVCLIAVASYFHEPWRDEYQALLLANSSSGYMDVIWRARYEGHPSLWYLILYLIPNTWDQVAVAKAIAVGIMAGAGWLIVFRAPFSNATKAGVLFGYFFCYEYSAFFRNYGLAVLFFLLTITLLRSSHRGRRWTAFIPLTLLPFTQIYGALLSAGLFACMVHMQWRGERILSTRSGIAASGFYLIAFAVAIWDIAPAPDANFFGAWSLEGAKVLDAMTVPAKIFLPFPAVVPWNWDGTLIAELAKATRPDASKWLLTSVSVLLITCATLSLHKKRSAQVLFLCSCLFILSFCALRFHGSMRHQGLIFIAYIGSAWLARTDETGRVSVTPVKMRSFLPFILFVQVASGITMIMADILLPFSGSVGTAKFLRDNGREENEIYSACEDRGISIAGALNRPVYYPIIHRETTYMEWNNERRWGISEEAHLAEFDSLTTATPGMLYLTAEPLTNEQKMEHRLVLIHQCPPTIRSDESFLLYERKH
ncbi:MAG: hypothetical protein IPL81_16760 [Flavobacteriales bacterium]|nr:hypothetical protein [Flavobacteriales bacterium]